MALEQDSVHSFLFISASNAALHRHFIFDFVIVAKHSKQKTSAELQKIFKILNDIMKMWAISHSQNRAYIDFNLKNLIYYEHDKIVFVDLFPPILNNINQTNSYKIKNQIDLWTDKYINLGSMLAYFVQPLVIKHKTSKNLYKILKYIFDNAFNIIENQTHLSKDDILLRLNKSSHVFAKRFVDIYKFATQSTDNQQFLDTYLNAKLF